MSDELAVPSQLPSTTSDVSLTTSGIRAAAPEDARLAAVEWLRLLACFTIVWAHAGPPSAVAFNLGIGGLFVFVLLMSAFAAKPGKPRPAARIVRDSAQRLLLPWVFWSAVFGVMKLADCVTQSRPLHTEFETWMLLTGPALHLWFLPFAFVATVLLRVFVRGRIRQSGGFWSIAVFVFLVTLIVCERLVVVVRDTPWHQYLYGVPFVIGGIVLIAAGRKPAAMTRQLILLPVLTCTVGGTLLSLFEDAHYRYIPAAAGATTLCCIAWRATWRASHLTQAICGLSYGIYLAHPLFLRVLQRLEPNTEPLVMALIVFTLTTAAVAVLKRTPLRRVV